jgi:hypothetical protein
MMSAVTTPRSAGWYPDPEGSGGLRWFDGSAWSDLLADPAPGAVTSATDAAPEPQPVPEEQEWVPFGPRRTREVAPEPAPEPEPEPEPLPEPIPLTRPEPEEEPEPEPELPPAAEEEIDAEPAPERPRRRIPAGLLYGLAALAVAGTAVVATLVLTADDEKPAKKTAVAAADPSCVRLWNTTDTRDAADLRVTVGQFEDAYARVKRVDPIPGTIMAANSCALAIFEPGTETHMILVSGVKDKAGYVDATTYPRAVQLGWPTTQSQANVEIQPDGTLRVKR